MNSAVTPFDLPELPASNPFAAASALPYGLESFDSILPEHYGPALELAIARLDSALAEVCANPDSATFDNTVLPLELAGAPLQRVNGVLSILNSSHQTAAIREITVEFEPKVSEVYTALTLSPELLQRVEALLQHGNLVGEQLRVAELYRDDLVAAGAGLAPESRARLKEIAAEISALGITFASNLVDASKAADFWVADVADLAGLGDGRIGAARAAAEAADPERFAREGGYLFEVRGLSNIPEVRELHQRDMREKVYRAAADRCVPENSELAARIATLRAEMASILGAPTYHHVFTARRTAKHPDSVAAILTALTEPATKTAAAELELIAARATQDGIEQVEPWDIGYYTERLKQDRFNLDVSALKSYFELTNVVEKGIFFAAEQLYGITFVPRPDLSGYLPDVKVWEIFDGQPGEPDTGIALFLGDFFARDTKRPGAWMNAYRFASELLDTRPVVINNCNYVKPGPGEPCLLSLQDVTTLFHEFGHALHGIFARSIYPATCAFAVPWDFIEFPSQVNEMWALWPSVLENYAKHVTTGETLPTEIVAQIEAAKLWGMGLAISHQLTNNAVDINWHSLEHAAHSQHPVTAADVAAFEHDGIVSRGITLPHLCQRITTTNYTHIFSGGYAGGYYTYIWSETFDADTVAWVKANGGLTRANGDAFRREILGVGATIDPLDAYRSFMGRDVSVQPLLERCGFVAPQ